MVPDFLHEQSLMNGRKTAADILEHPMLRANIHLHSMSRFMLFVEHGNSLGWSAFEGLNVRDRLLLVNQAQYNLL